MLNSLWCLCEYISNVVKPLLFGILWPIIAEMIHLNTIRFLGFFKNIVEEGDEILLIIIK